MAFTVLAFLLAFALDSFLNLGPTLRLLMLIAVASVFAVLFVISILRPLTQVPDRSRIARYLEEKHPHLQDRLITAVELHGKVDPGISKALLEKLLEDARFHIEPLNLRKSLQTRVAYLWSAFSLAVLLCVAALLLSNLGTLSLRPDRILTPWKFPTVKPQFGLSVMPGDVRLATGSDLQITATTTGFESDEVALYYATDDSSWKKTAMDATSEADVYVFTYFDLQKETKYYVKADDELSGIFQIQLYQAPQIKRVDLTYTYPKYTGLPERFEEDSGDIWAPEGTVVSVRIVSDKPLRAGTVQLGDSNNLPTRVVADTVLTTSIKVKEDDYYTITITDTDDLSNEPPPEYYVHALPNEPPRLTLEWPVRDIQVSMLEEVPIRVKIEDDFGLPNVSLKYVLNGDEEEQATRLSLKRANKQSNPAAPIDAQKEFEAEHLFFLEDMKVQPGDFLEYYVEATETSPRGDSEVHTSDIYFIEIRPFEMEFRRPLSQGQGGQAGSGLGRLSQTQREIIVATWKTEKKRWKVTQEESDGDLKILVDSQDNLREVTENTLFQLNQRSVFTEDVGKEVSEWFGDALQSMTEAVTDLKNGELKQAQVHQRKALVNLLRAEGQVKEREVRQSQSGGQSENASLDELAQLFEQEIDKLKNKYETLNNAPQPGSASELNEALQKVKELARRQKDFNRRMQELARQDETPSAERKRKIEELRREQEQIRRQTQELTRDMNNLGRQNNRLSRQARENLKRASSEMSNASHNLRNDNTELAAAKGTRALNRLSKLQEMLQRNQKDSLRREVAELDEKFQDLAAEQSRLQERVKNLRGKTDKEKQEGLQQAGERQHLLKEDLSAAQESLQAASSKARSNRDDFARDLSKVEQGLRQAGLDKKMERAEKLLAEDKLNSAAQAGKDILAALDRTGKELTKLRSALAETAEEKLDLALNQTRRLRDQIEAVEKRSRELQNESQQGEQGADGQSGNKAGATEGNTQQQSLDPAQLDWMEEALANGLKDLDMIETALQADSSLARQAGQLNRNLQRTVSTFRGGMAERLTLIQQQVLIPLRGLEAELAQRLELVKNREKLFLAREEKVPPGYEELVQKYYEALSETN